MSGYEPKQLYCPHCQIETNESGFCKQCGTTWLTDFIKGYSYCFEQEKDKNQQDLFNS